MRRGTVVLLLWTLVGVSCGQATDGAATRTTGPTPSASTPAATALPEAGCSPADEQRLLEDTECLDAADADLDGDGAPARVVLSAPRSVEPGEDTVVPTLRADLPGGRVVEADLESVRRTAALRIVGGADAGGGSGEELFVAVDRGASTEVLVLFALDDGELVEVRTTAGETFRFSIRGSVSHGNGVACRDADGDGALELVLLSAQRTGNGWEWEEQVHEWRDGTVELVDTRRGAIGSDQDGDPPESLEGYWSLDCGDVQAP